MTPGRREEGRRALRHRDVAVFAGLALFAAGQARAQWAVIDSANLMNTTRQVVQGAQQLQHLSHQLAVMQQQYNQLLQTYQAVAHLPEAALQQLAAQLNTQQFRMPLPHSGDVVNSLMAGTGLGQLGSLGQQFLQQNRLYAPGGADYAARQMLGTANSIAGTQAMLNGLYQSAAGRIAVLQGIEGQLNAAPDAKAVADLQARVQAEATYLQAQQVQAQVIQTWQASQVRNETQQAREQRRCQIDEVLQQVSASADGGSAPVSPGAACSGAAATAPAGTVVASAAGSAGGVAVAPGAAGDGTALGTMLAQDWGSAASSNASAMGVNPTALAATCVLESGCRNVAAKGGGTVSGAFQMTDSTYTADINKALQANPALANSAVAGLAGKMDPATQSIAASQDLKTAAQSLRAAGIQNPTVLDVRGHYNFGARYGTTLAQAADGANMSALMPTYTAAQLAANGIGASTTVGQWRAGISAKIGSAASQPVLRS